MASYAAIHTSGKVYAIEYFEDTAFVAKKMLSDKSFSHVKVHCGASYERPINDAPNILITETIGRLGPEENIVELCYEFSHRYPSVKQLIPYALTLFAQPVHSNTLNKKYDNIVSAYRSASHSGFDFENVLYEIDYAYSQLLQSADLSSATLVSSPSSIVSYQLGVTRKSAIDTTIPFADISDYNAVHVYFEAELDFEGVLSSSCSSPMTHWGHNFVMRPRFRSVESLSISYSPVTKKFLFEWR